MADDDRVDKLVEVMASLIKVSRDTDRRVNTLTEVVREISGDVKLLAEASSRLHERMEEIAERMEEIAAAHANSEVKIAALADAQIKTEGVVASLSERMNELAAAQTHTEQRLDALIDIVREMREGRPPKS
ncbi:MAG TPA: hypothetical protein VK421_13795 [Pyrinomonadaceae bacterium]|nr:hypothetical protein [Pyrinomonadaceae bacterium]